VTAYRHVLQGRVRRALIRCGYHSKPRFLIIGAQKAGTTALYYYLADHPDIIPAREKEIGFFSPEGFEALAHHPHHPILCPPSGSIYSDRTAYAAAAAWYHNFFPLPFKLGHRLTFEATPEYLYYAEAPRRIFRYDPMMKLIVLLRDPVERAFSAWNMYHNFDDPIYSQIRDTRSFHEAITVELSEIEKGQHTDLPQYIRRGLYAEQLLRYFNTFKREQVFVADSRLLDSSTATLLNDIADFLGLAAFPDGRSRPRMHVGRYETETPSQSVQLLRGFYRSHNQQLYELLNYDLDWP
jgi:hypothetical protein